MFGVKSVRGFGLSVYGLARPAQNSQERPYISKQWVYWRCFMGSEAQVYSMRRCELQTTLITVKYLSFFRAFLTNVRRLDCNSTYWLFVGNTGMHSVGLYRDSTLLFLQDPVSLLAWSLRNHT